MSAAPSRAAALLAAAPDFGVEWADGGDAYERMAAAEFLPCQACLDCRAELDRANARLARAHALLRQLRRIEVKPAKPEGTEDDPALLLALAHVAVLATAKARIDLYLREARRCGEIER